MICSPPGWPAVVFVGMGLLITIACVLLYIALRLSQLLDVLAQPVSEASDEGSDGPWGAAGGPA